MNLPKTLAGDFWGGLAAMLVALPAAIAFGVTIYTPLGGGAAAQGALAGILGALALGSVTAAVMLGAPRSADAVAFRDVELYVLSRAVFDQFAEEHKKAGLALMEGIASVLASRLRYTNAELRALEA